MGKGRVFSLSAVLSRVPFEYSKKSDVLEDSVVSDVREESEELVLCEVLSVWVVSKSLLDDVELSGLFLPQLATSKTVQIIAENKMKEKIFFIFILYILS
jgi:hypothetical protein